MAGVSNMALERMLVLAVGFLLDACFGDPLWMPHPVVFLGRAISALEKGLRRLFPRTAGGELAAGTVLAVLLPVGTFAVVFLLLWLVSLIHPLVRAALECFLCYQILATKSLRAAAMEVLDALRAGPIEAARQAVGRIVGRDTSALTRPEIIRATVETVAENTSDGVVAPMFFFLLGGAPLALAYKAVNTMDSMIGYKNERYLYFGRAVARLDDAANFIPARITALLMLAAARFGFDARGALHIWRRDRKNHASPNAGQPEAACAGALGVQLGGDAVYFGQRVQKPTLGDALRPLADDDIGGAVRLMNRTAVLWLVICCVVLLLVHLLVILI